MACAFARFDRSSFVDCASVEEELFGQRRLAGVGVRYDRKRAPFLDFFCILRHAVFSESIDRMSRAWGAFFSRHHEARLPSP